jgi:putative ABC transport system substrate-binding protein
MLIVLLFLLPCAAFAQANVTVLLSEEGGAYTEFANSLRDVLNQNTGTKTSAKIVVLDGSKNANDWRNEHAQLLIAVGNPAMFAAAQNPLSMPILNVLVSRADFLKAANSSEHTKGSNHFSSVFLDQSWARQFSLIRYALPERRQIGILLGKNSTESSAVLQTAAKASGLNIKTEIVDDEADLLPALKRLLVNCNVLLAVPDPAIYNRNNIASILLTSYRAQVPLFGFSSSYVKAGALAAIYSQPAQIAQQVAEIIHGLPVNGNLPPPQSPRYFSVSVNASVRHSLELDMDDESNLLKKLKQLYESSQ